MLVMPRLCQAKGFNADIAQGQPGGIAPVESVAPVSGVLLVKALHVPLPMFSHVTHAYTASKPTASKIPSIFDSSGGRGR